MAVTLGGKLSAEAWWVSVSGLPVQATTTDGACWTGAGATVTATMGMMTGTITAMGAMAGAAGIAAGAATMAMTMTVSSELHFLP